MEQFTVHDVTDLPFTEKRGVQSKSNFVTQRACPVMFDIRYSISLILGGRSNVTNVGKYSVVNIRVKLEERSHNITYRGCLV